MRRFVPAVAAALLCVGTLSACTGAGSATSAAGGASFADRAPAAAQNGNGSAASAAPAAPANRAIVTTGSLRLVTDKPAATVDRIRTLVAAAGGRVDKSTEDPGGRGSAQLQLRIPAAAFDGTLAAIQRTGDQVRDVTLDATDVTARVTDYEVRIANLRTSIDRLRALLAKATTSDALVQLEGALTQRQTSLEQLLAEQRGLADQVASATLTVFVVTPAAVPATGPTDFFAAVATGAQSLARAAAATLIGFGIVLPWLGVAGVLTATALGLRRALRRRAGASSA